MEGAATLTSEQLFKLLGSVRKVQRKIELLKPIIDKACDDITEAGRAAEKLEQAQAALAQRRKK